MGLFDIFKKKETNKEQVSTGSIIDLTKTLEKKGVKELTASVKLVLDCSGSMDDMYQNGIVKKTLERMAQVAFKFDDDGAMETMLFNNSLKEMPDVTIENLSKYSDKHLKNVAYGGTSYAPAIRKITKDAAAGKLKFPVFVIFITDGENSDKEETRRALREASNYEIYFQFVGIGYERFEFLRQLDNLKDRKFDNAGFIKIEKIDKISDRDLYDQLLEEFVDMNVNGSFKTANVTMLDLTK